MGPGWGKIIRVCFQVCRHNGIAVSQVKEKWGGLRFYIGAAPEWICDYIEEMEELSYEICEDCGAPGKPREGSWIRTLCDSCAEIDRRRQSGRAASS